MAEPKQVTMIDVDALGVSTGFHHDDLESVIGLRIFVAGRVWDFAVPDTHTARQLAHELDRAADSVEAARPDPS